MSENKDLNKSLNVSIGSNTNPLSAKSIRFMDGCPTPIMAKRTNSSNNTKSNSTQGQKPSDEKSKDK